MMSVHAKAAAATFDVTMLQSADLLSPQLDRLADGVLEQSERGVCECSNASSTIKYELKTMYARGKAAVTRQRSGEIVTFEQR